MKLTLDVKEHKAAFLLELLDTFKDFVAVELLPNHSPLKKRHSLTAVWLRMKPNQTDW